MYVGKRPPHMRKGPKSILLTTQPYKFLPGLNVTIFVIHVVIG